MINRYEDNKRKYQNVIQYAKNQPNLSEELKKDILGIIEKYRFVISFMEEQEVYDLVDKCAEFKDNCFLKKELHNMISEDGREKCSIVYNRDDNEVDSDEKYNC